MNQVEIEKMGKRCMFMMLWYTALKQKVYPFPHNCNVPRKTTTVYKQYNNCN